MPESMKKWKLHIGTHKGNLDSRDAELLEFETLDECKDKVAEYVRNLKDTGYYIWFAKASGPNGEEIKLHQGYYI